MFYGTEFRGYSHRAMQIEPKNNCTKHFYNYTLHFFSIVQIVVPRYMSVTVLENSCMTSLRNIFLVDGAYLYLFVTATNLCPHTTAVWLVSKGCYVITPSPCILPIVCPIIQNFLFLCKSLVANIYIYSEFPFYKAPQ